ncbi:transketolase [Liquorilactobacillus satsumensis]|uniref:transketolase n=1 Tax=Liquorilactobacillus satsumensis TaxID=259059 RepID=UPI001E3202C4|nr:transketolase [Liquorilactobacillus satsumensis]MCC7667787.1 transketolase [Liquorilactobacillus satsumensis]MCP9356894.1 transketolase [Liquorilactobacillus satsumensis]MCP9370841.1 transketolase [Liquorilactobacillus satsumensis]
MFDQVDDLSVTALRMLSIDAIEEAGSGHPGLPLDAAPMAYVLWTRHLKVYPKQSQWIDRDRFVLSAGHGSALLYSLLHLMGYKISIKDMRYFRKLKGITPGHPEYGMTDGVEATTGPLGQGLGMAVGMAIAEKHLAALYNKTNLEIIDHYTYALVGDGDLMEGISHEVASLAGHLKLNKLIVLYDSNSISLDGPTKMSFEDDTQKRFEAYGWQYLSVNNGNNLELIDQAIINAQKNTIQPTIIEIKTVIGYGSPEQGTNKVHGSPLGKEKMREVKKTYCWEYKPFEIPLSVYEHYQKMSEINGKFNYDNWCKLYVKYQQKYPELAAQLMKGFNKQINANWLRHVPYYPWKDNNHNIFEAGRTTSHKVISAISKQNPNFWGGSADLFLSNKTNVDKDEAFQPNKPNGRNIWFGVREFGEAAALNGICLHGGTYIYGSTFFAFSDYMRAAIRLSALQCLAITYVFTHDSIAVGEDGPTHEPIEQLMSLRVMPNVNVIRPADPNEVISAWKVATSTKKTPTVLVLSRQPLPVLPKTFNLAGTGVAKGGYVISPSKKSFPDGILIATGSEVSLAIGAQDKLLQEKIDVSVVSMPSFELFEQQSKSYKERVLPSEVDNRMSIEMGSTLGWEKYIGRNGLALGIDKFGASGDKESLVKKYGFTVKNIVLQYQNYLKGKYIFHGRGDNGGKI